MEIIKNHYFCYLFLYYITYPVNFQKMNITAALKKGSFLVSEPFSVDPYFSRSVVLLLTSDEKGVMGLVVNKPMRIFVKQIIPEVGFHDEVVFLGGPVEADRMFYLHNISFLEGVEEVFDGVFVGGDLKDLLDVVQADDAYEIKFFMGYAGWSYGQLEKELEKESWVLTGSDKASVFTQDFDDLWTNILKDLDDDYFTVWMNTPLDPHSN